MICARALPPPCWLPWQRHHAPLVVFPDWISVGAFAPLLCPWGLSIHTHPLHSQHYRFFFTIPKLTAVLFYQFFFYYLNMEFMSHIKLLTNLELFLSFITWMLLNTFLIFFFFF
jgi:hypothetical protein